MSKIYKIDDAEFEELIKSIALNNETIIDNKDPVLIFYTIAKYIFKEYAEELNSKISAFEYQQRDIIDEFKIYTDNIKVEHNKDFESQAQLLIDKIKKSNDEKINDTLYFIADKIEQLNNQSKEKEDKLLTSNFYVKLLLTGNIFITLLIIYILL